MHQSTWKHFPSFALFITIAFFCSAAITPVLQNPRSDNEVLKQQIFDIVNKYRESQSLPPLQINEAISIEAERHSLNMASRRTPFGHDGFEERVKFITAKLGRLRSSAENVAFGKLSARQVVDIWLKSPGHRKNILGKYTLTGIGIAKASDGTLYFTEIFAVK